MRGSHTAGDKAWMKIPCLLAVAMALSATGPVAGALSQPLGRLCLGAPQTREVIAQAGLIRPVLALRSAGALTGAEPVGVKLCQWERRFVYEIVLLHRDGRIAHVFIDAATGNVVESKI